jgi:quercetin dioxygenase-like cupin family protein
MFSIKNATELVMKNTLLASLFLLSLAGHAQNKGYQTFSYEAEGFKAPNTHYLGEAWLNFVMPNDTALGYGITKALFKANSTLNWHTHSSPQVLVIVDGIGYYQERGKDPILMKGGDVIKCDPGVEHWHSSSKESDVTYLAIYGGASPTEWTDALTQEAYDTVAEQLKD